MHYTSNEQWLKSLPLSAQQTFIKRIEAIYRSLPYELQSTYQKGVIAAEGVAPFAPALDGINGGTSGLGQWATLASGIMSGGMQFGAQTLNTVLAGRLAKDVNRDTLASNAKIAAAQAAASAKAQEAVQAAQLEAIRVAGATTVARSQIAASNSFVSKVPGGGLTVLGIGAAVILGGILLMRRRK